MNESSSRNKYAPIATVNFNWCTTWLFLGLDVKLLQTISLKAEFMLSSINYNEMIAVYVVRT